MTWPRAAVLAIALAVAGGTWAQVNFALTDLKKGQSDNREEVAALRMEVRELRDAYLLSVVPPPRVDNKGRTLK